jgi:glycerol uptake facilitator-like aquaporin
MKQRLVSEFLGTAFLLAIVVGSGIMGETLAQGNAAIALLANSLATGAGLFVLIQCLGGISGAHFNPAVSLVEFLWGRLKPKEMIRYWGAQFLGALGGVFATHAMFGQTILQVSTKNRNVPHLWFSELTATFGLVMVIALSGRQRVEMAPMSIAAYITAAYWFTSSTSFANPAVTFARAWSDSFAGIAPGGIIAFVLAQLIGSLLAFWLAKRVRA